jgi:hypothetical protein
MMASTRLWAFVIAIVAVGGAVLAERTGPAEHGPASAGQARSAVWICPHGGGPDWTGAVVVADPTGRPVQVRLGSLGPEGETSLGTFGVAAGSHVVREVPAVDRGTATVVEVFGGWAGVGWQTRAGEPEKGLGVEPCTPDAGGSWVVTGMPTLQGDRSFLIVSNPFAADAIVDVTLLTPDAPPVRDPDLTDLTVRRGTSVALNVSQVVPGKAATTATVTASAGRIVVGASTVVEAGGLRSVLGSPSTARTWYLPTGAGSGQVVLSLGTVDEAAVRFGALLRTDGGVRPAGGLVNVRQAGSSTATYPIVTTPASSVEVAADAPVVAALTAEGQGLDDAATGGLLAPALDWVVIPTVQEDPRSPGVLIVNPEDVPVTVDVSLLGSEGAVLPDPLTFEVPAGQTVGVPATYLRSLSDGSVLVRASGPVVALGASTSSGTQGVALYALAAGIPVPAWAFT